jgi:NAD(P)-binding Rossmann-like domain
MRVAIVGAGLAGLATAAGLHRAGHEVAVYEQAGSLRASGLAINLWSNATSLLPALGLPAGRIPGQPFSRMMMRGGGRQVAVMALPARGLPHVTVERADLLTSLAGLLPDGAISYGTRCGEVAGLAREHDLVVVADGAGSSLRELVTAPPGRRWTWTIWQATLTAEVPGFRPTRARRSCGRGSSAACGGCRTAGSPGSPSSPAARRATGPRCWPSCATARTRCCGRWPGRRCRDSGPSGGRPTCGRPGPGTAATSCWPATRPTRCCPPWARVPASRSRTRRAGRRGRRRGQPGPGAAALLFRPGAAGAPDRGHDQGRRGGQAAAPRQPGHVGRAGGPADGRVRRPGAAPDNQVRLAFQNCHRVAVFRPGAEQARADFITARSQLLNQRPEYVSC